MMLALFYAFSSPKGAIGAYKRYLTARELRCMRLSRGSPLLVPLLAVLGKPDLVWRPDDSGVDEQGCYELMELREEQGSPMGP